MLAIASLVLAVGLLQTILVIALIGVVVWLIVTYLPMPPIFKTAITIIAVVFIILWLIRTIRDVPL